MFKFKFLLVLCVASVCLIESAGAQLNLIKDAFDKLTHHHGGAHSVVPESAPICGSSILASAESAVSPEIVFISTRLTRETNGDNHNNNFNRRFSRSEDDDLVRSGVGSTTLSEYRFNVDNVSLNALKERGFNAHAPITFLIHGFTSGYPLQAWMTGIVDIYTINERQNPNKHLTSQNLFAVNWHFGARSINYPRAVANVPIVAAYLVKFIDRLTDELGVDSSQIQLVGHSLGAHLAGFTAKNTRNRIGRIYGLDPAGPCFGTLFGRLGYTESYPANQRLAPTDANEVITVVTNSELLGLDANLGHYSIFVEGGKHQPGCKAGMTNLIGSLETMTIEGGDAGAIACSHSRAPLLMTYRYHQGRGSDNDNDCQMVAYECENWDGFNHGHCGYCDERNNQCLLVGLNWQYPNKTGNRHVANNQYVNNQVQSNNNQARSGNGNNANQGSAVFENRAMLDHSGNGNNFHQGSGNHGNQAHSIFGNHLGPAHVGGHGHSGFNQGNHNGQGHWGRGKRDFFSDFIKPATDTILHPGSHVPSIFSGHGGMQHQYGDYNHGNNNDGHHFNNHGRQQHTNGNEPQVPGAARRPDGRRVMFLKTGDTQPFCNYQYQLIMDLNFPFNSLIKPQMSLVLQDEQDDDGVGSSQRRDKNSLSTEEFGYKVNDLRYTQLLTSEIKVRKITKGTMLSLDGIDPNKIKRIQINYMSNIDFNKRRQYSSTLCVVSTSNDKSEELTGLNPLEIRGDKDRVKRNRIYFGDCNGDRANH